MADTTVIPTITVPGAVWYDFLDPRTSRMQAELGLPTPTGRRAGKGTQFRYDDVPRDVALELADYLRSRGELLLSNSDPEYDGIERGWYRSAIKTADKIEMLTRGDNEAP